MPPLSLLIKPASGSCNMRCEYCFYTDETEHRAVASLGRMSEETARIMVDKALAYADGDCTFSFQGGEPTLAGLPFFRALSDYAGNHPNPKGVRVHYAIQTNGFGIDDEWAEFLSKHQFLVGLSLDGPAELHDLNRRDNQGKRTHDRIMKTVRLFEKHKVEYNILCVVTGKNAKSIQRIYQFYKKNNFKWLQFIPCLEPLEQERGTESYHLSVRSYGDFLTRIFDLWYQDLQKGE